MNFKKALVSLLLCFIMTIALIPTAPLFAASPHYYPGYPQGEIAVSKPEIGMKLTLNGAKLTSYSMHLDKQKVNIQYDAAQGRFVYQPTEPLSPGKHDVSISIAIEGYQPIQAAWDFTVTANAVQSFPEPDGAQLEALKAANVYRSLMGLELLRMNAPLNMAAKSHTQYMDRNDLFDHYQKEGLPGFTGISVLNRAQHYGYNAGVYEDISQQSNSSPLSAVDMLFDAPYHRIPFMDPASNDFGYGRTTLYHALNFGMKDFGGEQLVLYPTPGEKHIPHRWDGNEIPDPIRLYSGATYPVGYPIMVGVYGENVERVELVSAKLTSEDGTEVSIYRNSNNGNPSDNKLLREVILIPKSPLKLNHTYSVYVNLKAVDHEGKSTPYEKTWSFTTELLDGEGKRKLHSGEATGGIISNPIINSHTILFTLNRKQVVIDGLSSPMDVAPMMVNNRTYLPFRALGEALQADVYWDAKNKQAIFEKGDTRIQLTPGQQSAIVNGIKISLDNGAILKENRTMVPLRAVSVLLGAEVLWNSANKTVVITY
jgi:uncharacterized protein YkwD